MTEMVKAMFEISMYGDRGIRIQLGTTISKKTNERIRHFSVLLEKENIPGITNGFQPIQHCRFTMIHF